MNTIEKTDIKHAHGKNVIVVGGGAAGMFAAMSAAEQGCKVTVLEKMARPGRKLAITGKGRCNVTTGHDIDTALREFGRNGRFLRSAFSRFYSGEVIEILERLGVPLELERGKRYFPKSGRAADVVDALTSRLEQLDVNTIAECRVNGIDTADSAVRSVGTSMGPFPAERVILATGGASYPGTGSTGDGYRIAASLGHKVIAPTPALVPLVFDGDSHIGFNAISFENIGLELLSGWKSVASEFGDAMFTDFGITGPAALALGKKAAQLSGAKELFLSVNFKPALTPQQVDQRLQREFSAAGRKMFDTVLHALLPRNAAKAVAQLSGIPMERTANQITKEERSLLAGMLTGLKFRVTGTRPISEAIITSGGVALSEINPSTMESKLVSGLYACGELLDIDAGTGGFNLQAAFSTGWIAGESAAK